MFCLGANIAHAGDQAPPTLTLDPDSVEVGATFGLTVTGFTCGVDLPVTITPEGGSPSLLTTILVGDITGGAATVSGLTAPGTAGTYLVEALDEECRRTAADSLEVTQPTTTTSTTTTTTTTTPTTTVAPTTAAPTTTQAAIVPPAPTTPPAGLPATGQTSDGLVWAALASLLLGVGFVTVAARRS